MYISRERFNLDLRNVLVTARLVRHETVTLPKTCPRPYEGYVGQRRLDCQPASWQEWTWSLLAGSRAQLLQFFTAEEVKDKD